MTIKASFKFLREKCPPLVKSVNWLNEPKWLNRLTLYFILFLVIYITFKSIFTYLGYLHTDVDSARYMLSALVQSEVAIVAIVITLSLVAVQLVASSYSARVIDVFKKTPDLWILIGIYGVAIFYSLGVLKLVEKDTLSKLENSISFSYYLGIFAFVALTPYTLSILNLLKPSTIIKMLAGRITRQNILTHIEEWKKSDEKNPIQPIIDIVCGSLMRYDYETARDGLATIRDLAIDTFKNESFLIFSHLTWVGKVALSRKDEYAFEEVITCISLIGVESMEQKLEDATRDAVVHLGLFGVEVAEQKLEKITWHLALELEMLGLKAAEQKLEEAVKLVASWLEMVGEKAAEQKLEKAAWHVASDLGDLGMEAAKQKLEKAINWVAMRLLSFGMSLATAKLEKVTGIAMEGLGNVGREAAKQNLEAATTEVVLDLGKLIILLAPNLEDATIALGKYALNEILRMAEQENLKCAKQLSEWYKTTFPE